MWRYFPVVLLLVSATVDAFGPEGHLIAGYLAEPRLCAAARAEIAAIDRQVDASLGDFAELGIWADRIRSIPAWERSAPWHYMNIESDATTLAAAERAIRAYEHAPEGDVLWAIRHFATLLADRTQTPQVRADALRFVAHFIVDVHQPLHVGLVGDRGGNEIDVRYGTTTTNLHRFWDTDIIRLRGLSPRRYARELAPLLATVSAGDDAVAAAAESLAARPLVYAGLPPAPGVKQLSAAYLRDAQALTHRRLVQAAARLAAGLNRLLC
jgi:hypothetical protein